MSAWTVNSRRPLGSRTSADHGMNETVTTTYSARRGRTDMLATVSAIEMIQSCSTSWRNVAAATVRLWLCPVVSARAPSVPVYG